MFIWKDLWTNGFLSRGSCEFTSGKTQTGLSRMQAQAILSFRTAEFSILLRNFVKGQDSKTPVMNYQLKSSKWCKYVSILYSL